MGSSLSWGLNFRALVCGIFWSSSTGFSPGTPVSSPLSSVNGSAKKIKLKCDLHSPKLNSWAVPSYHEAHDMLYVVSALCAARDLHMIAPGPLERACWRQLAAQWGYCKKKKKKKILELRLSMQLLYCCYYFYFLWAYTECADTHTVLALTLTYARKHIRVNGHRHITTQASCKFMVHKTSVRFLLLLSSLFTVVNL